jgi:hypothetical protein
MAWVIIVVDLIDKEEYEFPEIYLSEKEAKEEMLALRQIWEKSSYYPDRVEER